MNKLIRLFNTKFIFSKIPKKETVILDEKTAKYYHHILKRKNSFLLHTRWEIIYLKPFLLSFAVWIKNKEYTLLQAYIVTIINIINPKNLITFTDYDIFFWNLKNIFTDKKLIIIQHTHRTKKFIYALLRKSLNKKIKIDFFCTWGDYFRKALSKKIDAKFITTGSLRNNMMITKKAVEKKCIVFVSKYRENIQIQKKQKKDLLTLLPILKEFCEKKNLSLKILSTKIYPESIKEKKWYSDNFGLENFKFIHKLSFNYSYKISNNYCNFVTIDSSFGYELIARKKKVILILPSFFEINKSNYKKDVLWTKKFKKKILFNIFSKLLSNAKPFEKLYQNSIKNLIEFNFNNKKLLKVFKNENIDIFK